MDQITRMRLEARAKVLKAMAHPSRLYMVEQLASGEKSVAELTELVGADMSTVSKHLSQLRAAGIVSDRRQGAQIYYRLLAPCVMGFFDCVENVLRAGIQTQIEIVRGVGFDDGERK